MGQKEHSLKNTVHSIYGSKKHIKPTPSEILNSKYSDHIFEVYSLFQGQLNTPSTGFHSWDISTDKFIIELDEERHFNRYRLATLNSLFYKNNKCFSLPDYQRYCRDKEAACLKAAAWRNNWKTKSSERQFCKSNREGDLEGNGSSRWKQRAFYDFLRDISSDIMKVPLIRISIYDTYKSTTVDQLLKTNKESLLLELVDERIKA